MKVNGSVNPGSFKLELLPNVPGFALARFFENVEETEEGFEYDEYRLRLLYYLNLEQDIEANFSLFVEQAKAQEEQDKSSDEKITDNKKRTDKQIGDVEDAVCELDEIIGERMSAIEDAICDIDMIISGGE